MTNVTISRELLENICDVVDGLEYASGFALGACDELRAALAAPQQPKQDVVGVVTGEGEGMPRYGLRWNGPSQPVSVPMADGYWTPWHLAEAECDTLRQQLSERDATITRLEAGIPRIQEQSHQMRQQRDRLAGLLADVKADYTHAIHWEDMHATMKRIDAALAKF